MNGRSTKRESGITLLEMTIAMALGTVVLGAAVSMYSQGVSATFQVSQRAEMQQDFRAAANILTKDLNLAGAGLGDGAAIALPNSSTLPVYGCDQSAACHLGTTNSAGATFPVQGTAPYIYGLLPGLNGGPTISTPPGQTDIVTVVYTDNAFFLDCYQASVASGTSVTFSLTVASQASSNCTNNGATIQGINDSVAGLTPGDLVWFTFGTNNVVAEVYGAATSSTTATFGSGDPLKMNQASSVSHALASISNGTTGFATRVLVVTYYIDSTVSPPRLMRQVNGHTPTPVSDGVVYMKFDYDLYNSSANTTVTNQADGGASLSLLPNQITKINILHMASDTALPGTKGYQGLDLETSVSARNLTYNNNYPLH